jgi:hypothetical protein
VPTIRWSQSGDAITSSSVSASTSPLACSRAVFSAKLFPCCRSVRATIGMCPRRADSAITAAVLSVELLSTTTISTAQSAGSVIAWNDASVSRSRLARL